MSVGTRTRTYEGLSCYTANLAAYLAEEWDPTAVLAPSIRLAVGEVPGSDRLQFSHHRPSLDQLPDGSALRYATAPEAVSALVHVADELHRHGRALVVVDTAHLPWSPAYGRTAAPHWLRVDGRTGSTWHVVDQFSGVLPDGEQHPFAGWLDEPALAAAMVRSDAWTPEQRLRNALAFGAVVPVPAGPGPLWLVRTVTPSSSPQPQSASSSIDAATAEGWRHRDEETLPFISAYLSERGAAAAAHLDDLWAAAGHRAFAYRWRLAEGMGRPQALARARDAWADLPRLLRVALESDRRGRPRPSLIRASFDRLLQVEEELA